ncbi:hypothetical protein ACS0TY_036438 [Phlomoides rotata]
MVRAPEDQDPELQPLLEKDSKSLQQLLPEIPFWIKNPDYDRILVEGYFKDITLEIRDSKDISPNEPDISPNESDISPCNSFHDKSKYRILHNLAISLGILPESLFQEKSRELREVRFSIAFEIVPFMELSLKETKSNSLQKYSKSGMLESKSLYVRSIYWSLVALEIVGIKLKYNQSGMLESK